MLRSSLDRCLCTYTIAKFDLVYSRCQDTANTVISETVAAKT